MQRKLEFLQRTSIYNAASIFILGRFHLELKEYLPTFAREENIGKSHLLFSDIRALRRPVLVIFDHYEDSGTSISDWVEQQLLAETETAPAFCAIIGGQKIPDYKNRNWSDMARHLPLSPITEIADWERWVERYCPNFLVQGGDISTVVRGSHGNPKIATDWCKAVAGEE